MSHQLRPRTNVAIQHGHLSFVLCQLTEPRPAWRWNQRRNCSLPQLYFGSKHERIVEIRHGPVHRQWITHLNHGTAFLWFEKFHLQTQQNKPLLKHPNFTPADRNKLWWKTYSNNVSIETENVKESLRVRFFLAEPIDHHDSTLLHRTSRPYNTCTRCSQFSGSWRGWPHGSITIRIILFSAPASIPIQEVANSS